MRAAASRRGAVRLEAATTNDNLEAVRFYQGRGMRLEHVRPGAVDTARADKPSIPLERDGMAIHDEWVLVRPLP